MSLKMFLHAAFVVVCVAALNFSGAEAHKCRAEGIFADAEDCTAYHKCIKTRNGTGFWQTRGNCAEGHGFSAAQSNCVDVQQVGGCTHTQHSNRTGRTSNFRTPEFDHLCTTDGFRCGDCDTWIDCVSGMAHIQEDCITDFTCQMNVNGFPHGVCYPRASDTSVCKCLTANEMHPDPFNTPYGFIQCSATPNKDPTTFHCLNGDTYDDSQKQCVDADGYPECQKSGTFAVENSCNKYYRCTQAADGFVRMKFTCTNTAHFYNEFTHTCSDPCDWTWDQPGFSCQGEGYYPNEYECEHYYKCTLHHDPHLARHAAYDLKELKCSRGKHFVGQKTGNAYNGIGTCEPHGSGTCHEHHQHKHYNCQKPSTCT